MNDLLRRIERHMRRRGMAPSCFGRAAVNDPRFVFDLRKGRKVNDSTAAKVDAWLDRHRRRR